MAPRVSKEEGRSKLGRGANCKERKEILTCLNIQGKTYDPTYKFRVKSKTPYLYD